MSNVTPKKPSFVFGYWRPWKENSNLFDSYLDYAKDTSLVKYGADTIGKYINQASKDQVQAINQLGKAIGRGLNVLSNQMADINENLVFLNRNLDIQIEQQKLSNLLLQNIAELLRVPDSEKERQHSIELGVKFFVNASKDADLYADALEELLKAESLMKQDYFVLHRIGCVYLYAEKFINPEKALDYFLRAAKYASVESDSNAARLASVLTKNFITANSVMNDSDQIGLLASDSFEKAAFSAYVLGRFGDAENYQSKALKFDDVPQKRFLLAKYQVRNGNIDEGVNNLSKCIEDNPVFAVASFKEIDLINEPVILNLISEKNQKIDADINNLADKWRGVESIIAFEVLKELTDLSEKSYEIKVSKFKLFERKANLISNKIGATESKIDSCISEINQMTFCTLDANAIQEIIDELIKAKDLPLEKMQEVINRVKSQVETDKLKIGSKFAGGVVFFIDKTGNHGLVCSDMDLGRAQFGYCSEVNNNGNGIADGSGLLNTKKIVDKGHYENVTLKDGWFGSKVVTNKIITAADLCLQSNHNGFNDWYLPTMNELLLIYKNLYLNNRCSFSSGYYWSSTGAGAPAISGVQFGNNKFNGLEWDGKCNVRAIRAF
jgi:hypothetical protein